MAAGKRADGLARYGGFLGRGDVLRLVISSVLARLPGGMDQLAVVLVVQHRASLAAAGAAAAVYAVGSAIGGPFRGRVTDRVGARRVLLTAGAAQATGLLGLLVAVAVSAPVAVDIALAGFIGVSLPPVNPVMRTIWSRKFTGADRHTAFSFESVLLDLTYIVGPALVAWVVLAGSTLAPLGLTAAMSVIGCAGLAAAPECGNWQASGAGPRHWLGAWRVAALRRLLPLGFFVTGSITVIELALVTFARAHGHPAASGYLIALLSVGSMAGGLCFGAMNLRPSVLKQLAVVSACLGAGYALGSLVDSVLVLGVVITVTGLFLAPAITLEYSAVDEVADPGTATESFALLNAAGQGGAALGAVLAGFAGQHLGSRAVFLVGAAMVLLASLLASVTRGPSQEAVTQPAEGAGQRMLRLGIGEQHAELACIRSFGSAQPALIAAGQHLRDRERPVGSQAREAVDRDRTGEIYIYRFLFGTGLDEDAARQPPLGPPADHRRVSLRSRRPRRRLRHGNQPPFPLQHHPVDRYAGKGLPGTEDGRRHGRDAERGQRIRLVAPGERGKQQKLAPRVEEAEPVAEQADREVRDRGGGPGGKVRTQLDRHRRLRVAEDLRLPAGDEPGQPDSPAGQPLREPGVPFGGPLWRVLAVVVVRGEHGQEIDRVGLAEHGHDVRRRWPGAGQKHIRTREQGRRRRPGHRFDLIGRQGQDRAVAGRDLFRHPPVHRRDEPPPGRVPPQRQEDIEERRPHRATELGGEDTRRMTLYQGMALRRHRCPGRQRGADPRLDRVGQITAQPDFAGRGSFLE